LTSTTAGAKTLTATYGGDTNFNGSNDTEAHQVDKGDTTTTILTDLPDPSVVGQSYTVTVAVSPVPPSAGVPGGTVTVSDGTDSCVITLTAGAGSCLLTSTTAGAKTLTATYGGDTNFNGSNDTEAHQVDKASTTTTITSDAPDPSVVGQAVPINYSVTVNAPGAGTPTGNVTVTASTGETCTGTIAAGSCSITFNSTGLRTLTAAYVGDGNFNGSTSAAEPHTVDKGDTTTTITSDNPDPSVAFQNYTVDVTVAPVAPAAGTPTGTVNVGDGAGATCVITLSGGGGSGSCTLASATAGPKTLTATYVGDTNFNGSTDTEPHNVNSRATTTTVTLMPTTVSEGSNSTVTATVTDVDSAGEKSSPTGTVTFSSSYAGDTFSSTTCLLAPTGGDKSGCSVSVTGGDNGPHTITVSYPGNPVHSSSSGTATLNVTNVPPTVGPITATPSGPQPIGSTISFNASFTDPGKFDTFTAVWNWDDGTTSSCPPNSSACTITWAAGSGTVTGSHTFLTAGVYTVKLTVTDDDGDSGQSTYEFVVIFDPNGGFVTGGGWINQPTTDAYPALPGKANFGFVSKYKKGNNTPEGETEFQFKAGDINFHSSAYDFGSLVISGGKKATYRGDGTVNGEAGYRFVLIAVDGDAPPSSGPDRFRIKITKGAALIYDNRAGSPEDPDTSDTTVLGGGSIVIHKN
jgi:hypothetical protein